jgi:hypothetical protein
VISPSGFRYLVCGHGDDDVPIFFENDNDVSAIWNVSKHAGSATALADRLPVIVLKNVIDLIGRQTMFLDMGHIAARRGIPNYLRPSHSTDTLALYNILLQ